MPILEFLYLAAENWSAEAFLDIITKKQKISLKNIYSQNFENEILFLLNFGRENLPENFFNDFFVF